MIFKKRKTSRGFSIVEFQDDYGVECNVQISSTIEPRIWLGVPRPKVIIMYKDAKALGLNLEKKHPGTNEYGFCDFPVPKEALIESRMHLTKKQAKELALVLLKFARTGRL